MEGAGCGGCVLLSYVVLVANIFLVSFFFISFFFSSASFLFMFFDFAQSNYDLLCLLVAVKICFALCKQGVCGM